MSFDFDSQFNCQLQLVELSPFVAHRKCLEASDANLFLLYYRKTNQISSLAVKQISNKAHNTLCCLTKFLPKLVRCTVKSFVPAFALSITNARSITLLPGCTRAALWLSLSEARGGNDGCVGRIESVDVLQDIKHVMYI